MRLCHETNLLSLRNITLSVFIFGCMLFAACKPEKISTKEPVPAKTYFPIKLGGKTLQLQLALTPAEQQKGLMFRKSLAEDHGMLFLFERPRKQGFWMKNTSLPLDIGYFDPGGELQEVHKLFPYDETAVASRSENMLIAIETNRGWYAKNDIGPGARLDMNMLKAAIIQRGLPVAAFAIED